MFLGDLDHLVRLPGTDFAAGAEVCRTG